jgi:stage III sporulation protein AD
MDTVMRITVLCVTAALLHLVVKRGAPEIALVLMLGTVVAGLLALGPRVTELVRLLELLQKESGLSSPWFTPLYKTAAIALVVRFGGDLCRDAGAQALAGVVETAGSICALAVAAPLLEMVVELILEMKP